MISMAGCSLKRLRSATHLTRRSTNSSKEENTVKLLQKRRQEKLTTSLQRYRESTVVTLLKCLLNRRKRLNVVRSTMLLFPSVTNTNSSNIATKKPAILSTAYANHQILVHSDRKSLLSNTEPNKFTDLVSKDQLRRNRFNHLTSSILLEIRTKR